MKRIMLVFLGACLILSINLPAEEKWKAEFTKFSTAGKRVRVTSSFNKTNTAYQ